MHGNNTCMLYVFVVHVFKIYNRIFAKKCNKSKLGACVWSKAQQVFEVVRRHSNFFGDRVIKKNRANSTHYSEFKSDDTVSWRDVDARVATQGYLTSGISGSEYHRTDTLKLELLLKTSL